MKGEETVPADWFWKVIETNARLAQEHLDWELYLLRIKAAVEMIEGRMQRYKRENG